MATSTAQYKVWSPMMGETEDDCYLHMAFDHEAAAKQYVERSYAGEAFECEMEVFVAGPFGELKKFGVEPEPAVRFSAREMPA